ncbi:M4 family metallopeptidase [Flaviaesturariibacter amylovorans]|uniref:T9SS type A sorting domain-containing protein n=1 Tax=Flaviaesturariibacter amylovorans TaxID=1084520 RepID=A0ABP8HIP6_9BACT
MNRNLPFHRAALAFCALTLPSVLFAQDAEKALAESRQRLERDPRVASFNLSEERLTPELIAFKQKQGQKRADALNALTQYVGARSGTDALQPARTAAYPGNFEVLEFHQYYKGVRVDRAGFKALVRDGVVQFYNGAFYQVPEGLALQPAVAKTAALSRAKALSGGRKFAWEDVQEKLSRSTNATERAALQTALDEVQPGGELVIVNDFSRAGRAVPRLAYKFNIYAAEPLFRAWIYIDAQDGHTLLVDKIIKHADEEGKQPAPPASVGVTVQTRYSGAQTIMTKQISGNDPHNGLPIVSSHPTSEPLYQPGGATWALIDDTRGNGVETYDMNGVGGLPLSVPSLYLQGKSFTDQDNNWTLAEHKRAPLGQQDGAFEAENDDIAWDAHWGAGQVYDYWLAKHNRLSFDGNNAKIKSFIHYGPAYDNAFWNGSVMTYGDGSGPSATGFKALTSLDVCAHEIGHGVCEFTSNLVYAKESGAMNEGFSDIWAACAEHYAMTRSGSTVSAGAYRPFYIGEQIGATLDNPLRRMDNPAAIGDPDTYGGANWEDPNCSPTLANDQCGVHTNSAVLNKWFFLLTAGSKLGTRPAGLSAANYYRADSDDEINDLGNAYRVNGLGFSVAENIAFLTETMLTSTATYAEARRISIEVATSLTGDPCSATVASVTNAWYAVGVGTAFQAPCTVTYGFVFKPGQVVLESTPATGCNAERSITIPILIPANTTATISSSGSTATLSSDWSPSVTKLTNSTNAISKQNLVVQVFNDGIVETDETINLKVTFSRTLTTPINATYVITVLDDDAVPVVGTGLKTLFTETFTRADGFGELSGWQETLEFPETSGDPLATGKNQWGVFDNSLAITGKEGATDLVLPGGTYNSASESRTLVRTPLIDARGLGSVKLKFDYTVQGEVDPLSADPANPDIERLPVFDYMSVAYSLDGVNFTELNGEGYRQLASAQPTTGVYDVTLPPSLANKQFYLAFRWNNDANAGGPVSVKVDNLLVTGSPRLIENQADHSGGENLTGGADVYVYSQQDGEVLARLKNNSTTKTFRCTNVKIARAGDGTFNLYSDSYGTYKVSNKVVRITPAVALVVSTSVTLFYTEAQLAALEQATGVSRDRFTVFQVNNSTYSGATSSNTRKYVPVYTALPGVGASYTITFTYYLGGNYALGAKAPVTASSAVTSREAKSIPEASGASDWSFTPLYPNPGNGVATLQVVAPRAERVQLQVLNSVGQVVGTQAASLQAGANRIDVNLGRQAGGQYRIQVRGAGGSLLHTQGYVRQ